MKSRLVLHCLLIALHTLQLGACGDSSGTAGTALPQRAAMPVGEAGGSLIGPNGATVVIPPGALRADTALAIGLPRVGSNPALPAGVAPVGATYALSPRGTEFALPVAIAIPFDPAQVPSGARVRLLRTSGEFAAGWREVADAHPSGNVMEAAANTAASFVVVVRLELP
jgi:hypothetical protein